MTAPPPPLPIAPPALPHGPPFRLVDRVLSVDFDQGQLVALRQLTAGDALWPAELPTASQLPGAAFPEVLLIEALCQAAACLNSLELARRAGPADGGSHHGYLVAITDFRFPARAYVGESLRLSVERLTQLGPGGAAAMVAFAGSAAVGSRQVAGGRLLFALRPK